MINIFFFLVLFISVFISFGKVKPVTDLVFLNENKGYALSSFILGSNDIYSLMTNDSGNNWTSNTDFAGGIKIIKIDSSNAYIRGSGYDLYGFVSHTNDAGQNWYSGNNNMPLINKLFFLNDSVIFGFEQLNYFGGYDCTLLLKSSDSGKTWIDLNLPIGCNRPNISGVFFKNEMQGCVIYGSNYFTLKTENAGTTWTVINMQDSAYIVSICRINDSTIIGADIHGKILKSTNYGINWQEITQLSLNSFYDPVIYNGSNPLGLVYTSFQRINDSVIVYLTCISKDNGLTWSSIDNGQLPVRQGSIYIPDIFYYTTLGSYFLNDTVGWVFGGGIPGCISGNSCGSYGFIYKTSNCGQTWVAQYDELETVSADITAGIFQRDRINVYPNPFNYSTTIKYSLNNNAKSRIFIYSPKGAVVYKFSPSNTIGDNSLCWDGRDNNGKPVPSGNYLVRIDTGDRILQKKVTLLR